MTLDERRASEGYLRSDGKTRVLWCRVHLGLRGYTYSVDVSPPEVLDVCRAFWLAGGFDSIGIAEDYLTRTAWDWTDETAFMRSTQKGGYSSDLV